MNIISYSLWGSNQLYNQGAIYNAILAKKYYNEWVCRFYVDKTVPHNTIETLKSLGSQIIIKDGNVDCKGSMWRFEVMFDDTVDRFICRDADARLTLREKVAVDQWINSDKDFHVMRDHPHHAYANWAIFAGMFGAKTKCTLKYKSDYLNFIDTNNNFRRGCDQDWLHKYLWNDVKVNMMCHDTYRNSPNLTGSEVYFPINLIDNYHVGAIVNPNESWIDIYDNK